MKSPRFSLCVLAALSLCAAAELLELNKDAASLVFVDLASGKLLARVPVGEGPHELVVFDDGKLAFAGNHGTARAAGNTISVIDVAARKEHGVSTSARSHALMDSLSTTAGCTSPPRLTKSSPATIRPSTVSTG